MDVEQAFRQLADELVGHAIVGIDPAGRIRDWPKSAERLTRYPAAYVVGEPYAVLFGARERQRSVSDQLLAVAIERGHVRFSGHRRRRDGSTFAGEMALGAVRADDRRSVGFVEIVRDGTDEQQVDRIRRTALHDLDELVAELVAQQHRDGTLLRSLGAELEEAAGAIAASAQALDADADGSDRLGGDAVAAVRRIAAHIRAFEL